MFVHIYLFLIFCGVLAVCKCPSKLELRVSVCAINEILTDHDAFLLFVRLFSIILRLVLRTAKCYYQSPFTSGQVSYLMQ